MSFIAFHGRNYEEIEVKTFRKGSARAGLFTSIIYKLCFQIVSVEKKKPTKHKSVSNQNDL